MKKLRLGVVGAGRLGGFHADKAAANPEVELIGVADVSEANRRRVAEKLNIKDFATVAELLAQVDAVVVATPSILHAEIGREVLNAGKHLLMEKPATTSGKSALELARLAASRNLVFQVGHVEQYNPAWQAAQTFLTDVRAGRESVFVDATRCSGYTFRSTDVGAVYDLMIHDLELVLSLIPSPVERVSAFGYSQFGGCEDAAFATLEFANGSVARLSASRVEPAPVRKTTLRTASQTLEIDFAARSAKRLTPKKSILSGEYAPNRVTFGEMASRVPTFMSEEYETEELVRDPFDALSLEMQDFVSSILRGTPSTVPGERAAQAVAVADAIIRDVAARTATLRPGALKIAG